jgi:hypothetical protein
VYIALDARWNARCAEFCYCASEFPTRKRWHEVLAEQRKQKADEDARAAEAIARRAEEKAEEWARFTAGNGSGGYEVPSLWAGRKLKVIVKVRMLDRMSHGSRPF